MKPGDNVEKSVGKLRRTTSAETDERILNDAQAALRESAPSKRPAAVKSKIAALTAAAVLIIVVFVVVDVSTVPPQEQPKSLAEKKAPASETAIETVREPERDLSVKPEAEPVVEDVEAELEAIERFFTSDDIDGLVSMLSGKPIASHLAAAIYLAEIGDLRALYALERLSSALGGGDPNNLFAITAAKVRGRLEQEKKETVGAGELKSKSVGQAQMIDEEKYINGWLIDANGDPVRGDIQLGVSRVNTSAEGEFTILGPNDYTKFIRTFGRAFDANRTLGCFFIWDKDSDTNDVEIMVEPLASVSGVVVDDNNDAVSDFRLEVSVFETKDTVYQGSIGEEPWEIQANADGSFDINSIPTGVRLQLAISKPGFKTLINLDSLAAGDELDLGRVKLEPMPGFDKVTQRSCSVSGFIVDENNEPLSFAEVSLTSGEEVIRGKADANGWYEFRGLPDGAQMEVSVYFDGYGNNLFDYTCSEPNGQFDIQIFPPAYDLYDKPAPGLFVREWLNTEPITLDELKGNVVLLCIGLESSKHIQFVQELNEIYSRYKDEPVVLLAIHKDPNSCGITEDEIKRFVEENGIEFAFGIDEEMHAVEDVMPPRERPWQKDRISITGLRREGAMYSLYEVKAEPACYLIDKNGLLRASPSQTNLEEWIEHLLGE
jgi:hypothetical protein